MTDILYWIWLSEALTAGAKNSSEIVDYFECDPKRIYNTADFSDITGRGKLLTRNQSEHLLDKSLDRPKEIISVCEREKVRIYAPDCPGYPRQLMNIQNLPLVLYCKGTMPDYHKHISVSCVGTRKMTRAGKRTAYEIAYDLAKSGIIITSGMAIGIDSVCHNAALDAGGITVAVLGSGIDIVYPHENYALMEEIIRNGGAVLTEYAPGTPPLAHNFPVRNRIVSGLSVGTVVMEAGERSGSLNTARNAEEQGKDIFSVPGESGEYTHIGSNSLLKNGAIPVTEASDIISFYTERYGDQISFRHIRQRRTLSENCLPDTDGGRTAKLRETNKQTHKNTKEAKPKDQLKQTGKETIENRTVTDLGEDCEKIVRLLMGKPLFPDEISSLLDMPLPYVLTNLSLLEIEQTVIALRGGKYTSDK